MIAYAYIPLLQTSTALITFPSGCQDGEHLDRPCHLDGSMLTVGVDLGVCAPELKFQGLGFRPFPQKMHGITGNPKPTSRGHNGIAEIHYQELVEVPDQILTGHGLPGRILSLRFVVEGSEHMARCSARLLKFVKWSSYKHVPPLRIIGVYKCFNNS